MTIFAKGLSFSLVLSLVSAPFSTQAWFLRPANAQGNEAPAITNVQTMDLLEPLIAMTSDRKAVDDDSTVTIVDGEALVATIGASGSLADVVDDAGEITVYIVKSGDTMAGVAKLFNITTNTVAWTNGLKSGAPLHVGDTLLIMPANGIKYTVASGDTLAGIEKRFNLTSDEIDGLLQYNDLGVGSKLAVGQTLYIPGAELNTSVATTKSGSTSKTSSSKGSANVTRGYFIRPLPTSCRTSQWNHDRYAVDLACPTGTPIRAAAAGTIQFAKYGWNGAFGNLVIMKHSNGMTTYYAHMKEGGIAVSQGQTVSQGDVIGYVGSTGRSTGPHLHFEVRGGTNPGFDRSGSAWKQ